MDPFPFAHISGRRPYATGESRDKWLPATQAAAAASRRRSCASWCNSSATTPTSSRSAPASENSTRRRLTGHAHAEHASRRFDENGILVIPSPPDLEKVLRTTTARPSSPLPAAAEQLRLPPRRLDAGPRPSTTAGLKYHKVVGEATTRRRASSSCARSRAASASARRRRRNPGGATRARPLKRARTESTRTPRCSSSRACGARTAPRARRVDRRVSEKPRGPSTVACYPRSSAEPSSKAPIPSAKTPSTRP